MKQRQLIKTLDLECLILLLHEAFCKRVPVR